MSREKGINKKYKYNIKKDYQAKNLKNPFFCSTHNKKKKFCSWKIYLLIFIILVLGLLYFLFLSPFFLIKDIKVSGLGRLPEDAISTILWQQTEEKAFWPLKQNNLLLFKTAEAEESLMSNFNFSKISITKKLFNSLVVEIEERPYAFIWSEAGNRYYSDSKGYIIKDSTVTDEDLSKFPLIENQTPDSLIAEDYLKINLEYLNFIFSLREDLLKYPDLKIDKFMMTQELNMLKVLFSDGLVVYFNIKDDPIKQIDKLVVVKKEKIKDNLSSVNYIDLRYGDKVYIGNK